MATIERTADTLTWKLPLADRIWGLRGNPTARTADIAEVTVVPEGLGAVEGVRAPGLGLPGVRKAGVWRARGGKHFVSVRRGQPAVVVRFRSGTWGAWIIGTDDPDTVRAELGA